MAGGIELCAGLILENFLNEQYKRLDIRSKYVLDIGANIGDTALYFALNGAKKVYALEPYPYSCGYARKNVKLNDFGGNIEVLNEGCGGKKRTVTVPKSFKNLRSSVLKSFKIGVPVKIDTIDGLTERYGLDGAVLKVDTEGAEYDIILNASNTALRRFDQIIIEYHFGYLNLKRKLEKAGFYVKHSMPMFIQDKQISSYGQLRGTIYAKLK